MSQGIVDLYSLWVHVRIKQQVLQEWVVDVRNKPYTPPAPVRPLGAASTPAAAAAAPPAPRDHLAVWTHKTIHVLARHAIC